MLDKNHQNTTCAFAEPLISYLYGEIGAAEKSVFETHLQTCAVCNNELAEFGFARTMVQEWRAEEFDKLTTPVFEIPGKSWNNSDIQAASESQSWFAGWRQIFAFKPALALSACAVLVVLFGTAIFIFNSGGEDRIAEKSVNQNIILTAVTPTVEKVIEQPKEIVEKKIPENAAPPESLPTKVVERKQDTSKNSMTKTIAAAPERKSSETIRPVKAVENKRKETPKSSANAQKSTVPRLTEAEDEEDNSVRLADLFDEIETR